MSMCLHRMYFLTVEIAALRARANRMLSSACSNFFNQANGILVDTQHIMLHDVCSFDITEAEKWISNNVRSDVL